MQYAARVGWLESVRACGEEACPEGRVCCPGRAPEEDHRRQLSRTRRSGSRRTWNTGGRPRRLQRIHEQVVLRPSTEVRIVVYRVRREAGLCEEGSDSVGSYRVCCRARRRVEAQCVNREQASGTLRTSQRCLRRSGEQ
eukprot:2860966-Pleurochrysis_carterae.AAC.1